jgi:hypothetical protein
VAIFDGDDATATVAVRAGDRLDACADGFRERFVHDPWLARRLPALVRATGLEIESFRSHGYVEALASGFTLKRRVDAGTYFGHIAYVSLVGRKKRALC